jgi:hypothetical protein
MEAKNREKHKNSLKNTLVAFLIKNYIIKMHVFNPCLDTL